VRFEALGPLQVRSGGAALRLQAKLQRRLLGVLLSRAGNPVSPSELIEALWGSVPPPSAVKGLQIHVRRLRQLLGEPERIRWGPVGYTITVQSGELDITEFEGCLSRARMSLQADDTESALRSLDQALGLWRGGPYGGLEDCAYLEPEMHRLVELWLQGLEERADIALRRGRQVELLPELMALVAEYPYRERFTYLLMVALYRCGRQAEALDVFQRARTRLADDLGLDTGPTLRGLHERILRDDPELGVGSRYRKPVYARTPEVQAWSAAFTVRPMPALSYLREYEATASEIRTYEPVVVPGLLQTEEHMRALFRDVGVPLSRDGLERAVEVRLERQAQVERESNADLHIIVDEAVVRRPVGGLHVHKRQLAKIRAAAESSVKSFQVVTLSAGSHPGLVGPFTIYDFGEDVRPPLACVEGRAGTLFMEDADNVRQCRAAFDAIHDAALSRRASVRLIDELMRDL
jgi:DNA-binding SARP family transcriptional activator